MSCAHAAEPSHYSCQATLILSPCSSAVIIKPSSQKHRAGRWQKEVDLLSLGTFSKTGSFTINIEGIFWTKRIVESVTKHSRKTSERIAYSLSEGNITSQTLRFIKKSEVSLFPCKLSCWSTLTPYTPTSM